MASQLIPDSLGAAVDQSLAWIEFSPDGEILACNKIFSALLGYSQADLVGQHHRIFLSAEDAGGNDYIRFWENLRAAKTLTAQYKRLRKDGAFIWLQATYVPIIENGAVSRVFKIAADITHSKLDSLENESKMRAIGTTMAIIEFSPQGEILSANKSFLNAVGYSEKEIKGCHHGIFVADIERCSDGYKQFWASLASGKFCRGQFTRYAKDGKPVELEACYQPILNENGKVVKVIKFAYDVTAQKQRVLAELQARADQIDQAKLEVAQEVERRVKLDALLDEVSIPITPVWDHLLMVPLVGFIDTNRSEKIMDRVLADIVSNRARELIVDISGVPVVDTDTASRLVSIARAASLMGCHSTISGISPQIAKTITLLGVDLEGMSTTGTLMDAISGAYERLDFAVSKCSSHSPQNPDSE